MQCNGLQCNGSLHSNAMQMNRYNALSVASTSLAMQCIVANEMKFCNAMECNGMQCTVGGIKIATVGGNNFYAPTRPFHTVPGRHSH